MSKTLRHASDFYIRRFAEEDLQFFKDTLDGKYYTKYVENLDLVLSLRNVWTAVSEGVPVAFAGVLEMDDHCRVFMVGGSMSTLKISQKRIIIAKCVAVLEEYKGTPVYADTLFNATYANFVDFLGFTPCAFDKKFLLGEPSITWGRF